MQLDRYIYTICIVHTDELRKSRQAIYMRQRSGHAQFEFTYDQFSRDAVQKATLQQILLDAYRTNGLSVSLPETQVNRTNCQNISLVKNESFMRNKGPVFLCPNIYGQQKYPVRNVSGNIEDIK